MPRGYGIRAAAGVGGSRVPRAPIAGAVARPCRTPTPHGTALISTRATQITDVGAEVRDLRERHRQIHTWGSANLLQTLFREALVDQMNLWRTQHANIKPNGRAAKGRLRT